MDTEARRLEIQNSLDSERNQEERNKLGQFATPPALAREVTDVALAYVGKKVSIRFLEPSIGSGSFYSALLDRCPKSRIKSAQGCELDERFAEAARALWSDTGLVVRQGDFTRAGPPSKDADRATLLLANPPYVRHHHLGKERKVELQAQALAAAGVKVSGLTGLYVYFMLLSHEWLAEGGVAAWLIPSEWMDVNYGEALKEYLRTKVELLRVHRFDAADVQFGDALVSTSIVYYRKAQPSAEHRCEMTFGPLSAPTRTVQVSMRELAGASKWGQYFKPQSEVPVVRQGDRILLGSLVDVKRGIATGRNDFFIRSRDEFRSLGIPEQFLRPVLPSSRYLPSTTVERGADGYPALDEPLALLDCDLPEAEVEKTHPALWRYLDSPEGQAVRKGYLTSGRSPWYAQERRPHAPVIATYMGRGRGGKEPFKFFWNRSDATGTNVYLLLIPKGELAALLKKHPEKGKLIVDFLKNTDTDELVGHGRVYGGGLHKLEPKELGRLDATALATELGLAAAKPPQMKFAI